jgi:hypothetical protein
MQSCQAPRRNMKNLGMVNALVGVFFKSITIKSMMRFDKIIYDEICFNHVTWRWASWQFLSRSLAKFCEIPPGPVCYLMGLKLFKEYLEYK